MNAADPDEEAASLLSVQSISPSPDTLTKLVKRLRALTLALLPVEVDTDELNNPTSRVITPQVIAAYKGAAGDFVEALPYCLLRARAEFLWDANHNPADFGENHGRAIACEVIARRVVHLATPDRLTAIVATRFRHREIDGDVADSNNVIELAIDQHCTIFLSSSEAQDVINELWAGKLVQENNAVHDIDYVEYDGKRNSGFWSRIDPSRISVPRYQNIFNIIVWLLFLVVYSQAVREPLERLDIHHQDLDEWECVLYGMAFAFWLGDTIKFYKLLRYVSFRAFTFWNIVAFMTDYLLLAAFILRIAGIVTVGESDTAALRLKSFQVLSFVAPLIWMKLVTIFDGYKYIGTMQICIARMLQESGIFFALLSVLALGFGQGLYALDAADGETEQASSIIHVLIQALLQSPNYEKFAASPAGLILYYFWNLVTAVILLNVLISLFSSAYADVVEDAEAQYLAFFAGKTVGMIRAPDHYVYPAPFNLVEFFLIAPFEVIPGFRLSPQNYAKLNKVVMTFMFFVPLAMIAAFEATFSTPKNHWMRNWMRASDQGEEDSLDARDPTVTGGEGFDGSGRSFNEQGLEISKVPFSELVKAFPNTNQSSENTILEAIRTLKEDVARLRRKLEERGEGQ